MVMRSGPRKWPCRACGGQRTPEGYDPCVGFLAGAQHVCCGHGLDDDNTNRYVVTDNGRVFRGLTAFQAWRRWVASPEGRAVAALAGHTRLFGWLGWHGGRHTCGSCRVPLYECSCVQRPGQFGDTATRPRQEATC